MSGPKVVRIVSRDEVISICEGLLAQLDAAYQEWLRVGTRNEVLSGGDIANVEARQLRLKALLARDQFLEIQKAIPNEIAALRDDTERRLTQAAAAAAAVRASERRVAAVAASVLETLSRSGIAIPPELGRDLADVAAGGVDRAGTIVRGFRLLGQVTAETVTDEQRALAAALKEGDDRLSVEEWLANQAPSPEEHALNSLDRHVATLRGLGCDAAASMFDARLAELHRGASGPSHALRRDSLEMDMARAVGEARARHSIQARLRGIAAQLAQLHGEPASSEAAAVLSGMEGSTESLTKLELRATAVLVRAKSEVAAAGRRKAVLEGLAAIGYQISGQMETAWVRDGRVVLKKASQPGYGVEIGGGADAAKVQMRTVAFRGASEPADPMRDRDAETVWCGDLDRLRAKFASAGGEIVIETSLGVGEAPLRVVTESADGNVGRGHATDIPKDKALKIPPP